MVGIENVIVKKPGIYDSILFPSALWTSNGTYTMTALYGTSQSFDTFDFMPLPEVEETVETTSTLGPTQLNIKQYFPGVFDAGETIEISADMDAGTGHSIILSVQGPTGQILLQPLNTDSSGSVDLNFSLSDDLVTGTYTITAQSVGAEHDLHDKLDIVVIAPIPELNVSEVKATKEDGTKVSKYDAGELAYFSTNLTTESNTPVLVTVNVLSLIHI